MIAISLMIEKECPVGTNNDASLSRGSTTTDKPFRSTSVEAADANKAKNDGGGPY